MRKLKPINDPGARERSSDTVAYDDLFMKKPSEVAIEGTPPTAAAMVEGTIKWRKAKIKLTAHDEAEPRLSNGLIEAFFSTMTMVFLCKTNVIL